MAGKAIKPTIRFGADFDAYKRELKRAIGQTDKFDRSLKGAGKKNNFRSIGKAALGAAAGIGAVSLAANELRKSVQETSDLAKATRQLQRATGLSADEASRLAGALKMRNIGTDKASKSFVKLAGSIEAAKTGTGAAADNFRKLGVSQDAIRRGDVSRILLQSADGFKRLGDSTGKAQVAQALFGRNARELIPLFEGGSKALREQLALVPGLTQKQVEQGLAATKAQRDLNTALYAVRVTLGTAVLPYVAKGAEKLSEFIAEMRSGKGEGGKFAAKLKEIWNAIKPAVSALGDAAKAVFEFAAANPKIVKMAAYLAAVGLAIKAIKFAGAISGMSSFLKAAGTLGGKLVSTLRRSGSTAGSAAMNSAANSAANSASGGVMTAGGRGKKFEKGGKFVGKWIGRGLAAGIIAGIILFGPELAKRVNDWFSANLPGWLKGILGIRGGSDPRSPYFEPRGGASSRSVEPGARGAGGPRARAAAGPVAPGSAGRPTAGNPSDLNEATIAERTLRLSELKAALEQNLERLAGRKDAAGRRALKNQKELLRATNKELGELERANTVLQARRALEDQIAQARLGQLNATLDQNDAARNAARNQNALEDFQRDYARLTGEMGASSEFTSRDQELTALISQTQGEAGNAAVQANYQRQRTRLNAQIARAEARGDLELKDQLNSQLAALDERYGADRLQRLINEQNALRAEETARQEAAKEERERLVLEEQQRNDDIARSNNEAAAATYAFSEGVRSLIDNLMNGVISFSQFAGQLAGAGGPAVSKTDATAGVIGKTQGFKVPSVPKAPKKKKKTKGKASGGMLSPGVVTMVGETGPELIMASRSGMNVLSGTRTQRMGGAAGVTNITINAVRGAADDPRLLAREIGWQLATR